MIPEPKPFPELEQDCKVDSFSRDAEEIRVSNQAVVEAEEVVLRVHRASGVDVGIDHGQECEFSICCVTEEVKSPAEIIGSSSVGACCLPR